MLDLAAAYRETQANVVELVRSANAADLEGMVPATPAWSVKDVVAHVTGVAADAVTGSIPAELDLLAALIDPAQAERRDDLTARQVASRRDRSIDDVIEEWCGHLPTVLAMIRGERPFPQAIQFGEAVLVTDLATHAQDVRGALGRPGDRDSAGVSAAFVSYATALRLRIAMAGLAPLRLRYDGKERVIGDGEPGATVSADRFELFRALAGRRSRDQIVAMDWEGDAEAYADLIPAYGPRADPVVE